MHLTFERWQARPALRRVVTGGAVTSTTTTQQDRPRRTASHRIVGPLICCSTSFLLSSFCSIMALLVDGLSLYFQRNSS